MKTIDGGSAFGWLKVILVLFVLAVIGFLLWKIAGGVGSFFDWLKKIWDAIIAKLKSFDLFGVALSWVPGAQAGTSSTPNTNASPFVGTPNFSGDDWTTPVSVGKSLQGVRMDAREYEYYKSAGIPLPEGFSDQGTYAITNENYKSSPLEILITGAGA
jgi:hypothetical protein